jgi:hypothetical protein
VTAEPVRAGAEWLALREPADAAARSPELVEALLSRGWPSRSVIHDLGSGSGSMARWLAPRLTGAQHWVLHDRDVDLLQLVAEDPPGPAADGAPVTWETRSDDITRLDHLGDADLVTASALLDMLTAEELERLVTSCAAAGCPVLLALSVVGRVQLGPADPLDQRVADAFNAHQRREGGSGRLLGPDAAAAARDQLASRGMDVLVRASPWRLGPGRAALAGQWLTGWLGAACEQDPRLEEETRSYARERLAQARSGALSVTLHHEDLLALPR